MLYCRFARCSYKVSSNMSRTHTIYNRTFDNGVNVRVEERFGGAFRVYFRSPEIESIASNVYETFHSEDAACRRVRKVVPRFLAGETLKAVLNLAF